MSKRNVRSRLIVCVIGILVGVAGLFLGINMATMYIGTKDVAYLTFGADYYTESQQAMAATANNIVDLIEVVQESISYLICLMAGFIICYFALKLCELICCYMSAADQIRNNQEYPHMEEMLKKEETMDGVMHSKDATETEKNTQIHCLEK